MPNTVIEPLTDIAQINALPDFSIIGLRMPLKGERQPHLIALEKDEAWFIVGDADPIALEEIGYAIEAAGPAVLLWSGAWPLPEQEA